MQVLRRGMNGLPQDQVRAANGMLGSSAIQDEFWPYWWAVPRSNAQPVQEVQSIPAPVAGVLTEVASVIVPVGFRFVLRAIRQSFSSGIGGAPVWTEGSGDIQWTIDVDNPISALQLSGYGLPYMSSMKDARGSQISPWPVEGYNVFDQYQVIRYKVLTTLAIAPGAPNFITCGLFGWFDKAL